MFRRMTRPPSSMFGDPAFRLPVGDSPAAASAARWLQILLFPLQTSRPGLGKEADMAFPILHFPMLSAFVKFEVAGLRQLAEFELASGWTFGPEGLNGS